MADAVTVAIFENTFSAFNLQRIDCPNCAKFCTKA